MIIWQQIKRSFKDRVKGDYAKSKIEQAMYLGLLPLSLEMQKSKIYLLKKYAISPLSQELFRRQQEKDDKDEVEESDEEDEEEEGEEEKEEEQEDDEETQKR